MTGRGEPQMRMPKSWAHSVALLGVVVASLLRAATAHMGMTIKAPGGADVFPRSKVAPVAL